MFSFIKRLFSKKEEIKKPPLSPKEQSITIEDLKFPLDKKDINIEQISFIEIEKLFSINSTSSLDKKMKIIDIEYSKWHNRRSHLSNVIREEAREKNALLIKLRAYYKSLE